MDALSQTQLQALLARVNIVPPERRPGTGRELRHAQPARRTLVIHFGEADPPEYISGVLSIVLSSHDSWLLVPRHGPASKLGIPMTVPEAEALAFGLAERNELCSYLCQRDMSLGSVSSDLYALSADGNIILTWDHHTADEGLCVALRDVKTASKLLSELNDFGAELEVYYIDG